MFQRPRKLENTLAVTPDGEVIEVSTIAADGILVRWPETCIFREDNGSDVVATYNTEDEAVKGHAEIVEKIKKGELK
jgi:hypothetical protein